MRAYMFYQSPKILVRSNSSKLFKLYLLLFWHEFNSKCWWNASAHRMPIELTYLTYTFAYLDTNENGRKAAYGKNKKFS